MSVASSSIRPVAAVLRDFAACLYQQMFYWGMDAAHPGGNLFVKEGFTRTRSLGLQGTRCYGLAWQGGEIFLHGACAGWFPNKRRGGFLFIRKTGRCYRWEGDELPVPGEWPSSQLAPLDPDDGSVTAFVDWLLAHEEKVKGAFQPGYRLSCYREHRTLPQGRPWLEPEAGEAWLRLFRNERSRVPPAKRFIPPLSR